MTKRQAAQNEAATAYGTVRRQKTAADIVNSDAVSERSAKRVSPRAVLLRRQNGSGIAPRRAEYVVEIALCHSSVIFLR